MDQAKAALAAVYAIAVLGYVFDQMDKRYLGGIVRWP
jgi:hypothetical protein